MKEKSRRHVFANVKSLALFLLACLIFPSAHPSQAVVSETHNFTLTLGSTTLSLDVEAELSENKHSPTTPTSLIVTIIPRSASGVIIGIVDGLLIVQGSLPSLPLPDIRLREFGRNTMSRERRIIPCGL